MKKGRKILALVVAIAMVFALAACNGGGGDAPPDPAPAPAPEPAPAPAPEPDPEPDTGGDTAWNPDNIGSHTFIMAHGMPDTGMTGKQYHEFAVFVDELSGGKMKIDEKINGTLLTDTETLDGVMNGTADFVHSMGSFVTGTITDLSPLTIAGYYGGDDWYGFINDTRSLISSIYAEYGIIYMGGLYQGDSVIVCTERQIKSPGDVKGLTFRASGTWVSKTVEAWGGAATVVPLADLQDAFSKKMVQGVATGLNIIVPFKIYEVANYVTKTTMSEGFAALLMNADTWNSLNADEQALLTEAARLFEVKAQDLAIEFMGSYMADIEAAGNDVYYLTPAEQQEFVQLGFSLYPEMEPDLGPKGIELMGLLKAANGIS